MTDLLILTVGLAAILFLAWRFVQKRKRRAQLLAAPLSDDHRHIVRRRFPLYRRLPPETRKRLEGLINRFLDEISFIGRDGMEITDDVRLTIASQACLLIVNRPHRWFPTLRTVIVYPGAFKSKVKRSDGYFEHEAHVHAGESWQRGPVVLSWDHTVTGGYKERDGHNVVLHEFAHQLDEATGVSDGAPLLDKDQNATQWALVFQYAYEHLQNRARKGMPSVFDHYGAIAPAEFFAVAVETFFEKPHELSEEEPKVYEELARYFGLDPMTW